MDTQISFLAGTALTIGALHTLAGPDHYLPFVAMSKARNWTVLKTVNVVILCGIGHVFSSVIIGFIGIAAGIAISGIQTIEGTRGSIAAWLLLIFGLVYMMWGFYQLWRKSGHHHDHEMSDKKRMTFWILFTIFIFGPCEPLIPILMYPAAAHNYGAVAYISILFAATTIGTMIIVVLLMLKGISFVKLHVLEKYQHVLAGGAIAACGSGIVFLGL
jgi:nickel/cobalt transporter (NicO) family protein